MKCWAVGDTNLDVKYWAVFAVPPKTEGGIELLVADAP